LYFLVMEYIGGISLSKVLDELGAMPTLLAVRVASQICQGLQAAHRQGIVHGELTPNNIMMDRTYTATILDFGLARWIGAGGLTAPSSGPERQYYMSPEQRRGDEIDPRSDLYSVGVLLMHLVTGQPPPVPAPPLPFPANVPRALRSIIVHCLESNPDERYASALELYEALKSLAEGRSG